MFGEGEGIHWFSVYEDISVAELLARESSIDSTLSHVTAAWTFIGTENVELGAEISEREGSRVAVVLFEEVRVFHRPHPAPDTDKGVVTSIRRWLEQHGVEP